MLSHIELLQRLNLVPIAEPMAKRAYEMREQRLWEQDLDSSPHGQPWHTSFHASSFPGDSERPCARKALYGLLNLPSSKPGDQFLRAIGDAGKAIEDEYTSRWEEAGMLLSAPPTAKYQTGFSEPRYWLSGNLDAVIRPPGWNRGHVVDLKSKDHDVVDAMKRGQKQYEMNHYYQVQTYLGCLRTAYLDMYRDWARRRITHNGILRIVATDEMCDTYLYDQGLGAAPDSCSILYVSRNRPRHTHEFVFQFDRDAWIKGTDLLYEWKHKFMRDELPARPKDWRWLEQPCQYCAVKKLCKADDKAGVTKISESGAIPYAKLVRPSYDFDATVEAVLDRWRDSDTDIPSR